MSVSRVTGGPSDRRPTGWMAGLIWAAVGVSGVLMLSLSLLPVDFPLIGAVILATIVLSFSAVGAVIVGRQVANAIGWILWVTGVIIAVSISGNTYATLSVRGSGGLLPFTVPVAFIAQADLVPLLGVVAIFLPMLFPDGRLPSPRWRWAARYSVCAITFASVLSMVVPGPLSGGSEIPNPLGIGVLTGVGDVVGIAMVVALGPPLALAVASVFARYRRAGPVERQQLKWFAGATAIMVLAVALGGSSIGPMAEGGWLLMVAGLALLPLAIGVAVLRYHLYEIDRIVSRTISYALVTAVLVGAFAGAILVFQTILAPLTGKNTIAVAASTLVVAALFQPLRVRVQRVVDRRFNRARYDAERTATAFAERLRDEVDLRALIDDLQMTTRASLAPAAIGLWIRGAEGGG